MTEIAAPELGFRAVVTGLAEEGVPVRAMARALQVPSDELWPLLRDVLADGEIVALPPADWPPGSHRDGRAPGTARLRLSDAPRLVLPLRSLFGLTRAESAFLATLLCRREASREALHAAVSADEEPDTEIKIVDAYACRVRATLRKHGITLETVWGTGFRLARPAARAILDRVAAWERDEEVSGFGPARPEAAE